MSGETTISEKYRLIAPIAAFAALGNLSELDAALHRGLDSALTVSDAKEVLVQLYAYAGFPRSLNGLGQLMKTVEARRQRGIVDTVGVAPARPIPTGDALFIAGSANQTKLAGAPVKGPLFDFAPAIDRYLKTHLFGDIFERDNLDWGAREIATVAILSALDGVESQLQSHIRISVNVGVSAPQLNEVADALHAVNLRLAADRLRAGLDRSDFLQ